MAVKLFFQARRTVRVLSVDDFEPWRVYVRSVLKGRPGLAGVSQEKQFTSYNTEWECVPAGAEEGGTEVGEAA